jgi:hypothetical protein
MVCFFKKGPLLKYILPKGYPKRGKRQAIYREGGFCRLIRAGMMIKKGKTLYKGFYG